MYAEKILSQKCGEGGNDRNAQFIPMTIVYNNIYVHIYVHIYCRTDTGLLCRRTSGRIAVLTLSTAVDLITWPPGFLASQRKYPKQRHYSFALRRAVTIITILDTE